MVLNPFVTRTPFGNESSLSFRSLRLVISVSAYPATAGYMLTNPLNL